MRQIVKYSDIDPLCTNWEIRLLDSYCTVIVCMKSPNPDLSLFFFISYTTVFLGSDIYPSCYRGHNISEALLRRHWSKFSFFLSESLHRILELEAFNNASKSLMNATKSFLRQKKMQHLLVSLKVFYGIFQ